eukprot:scaffold12063_cov68-Phaeocystis_antarctica.AAC.1
MSGPAPSRLRIGLPAPAAAPACTAQPQARTSSVELTRNRGSSVWSRQEAKLGDNPLSYLIMPPSAPSGCRCSLSQY